MAKRINEILKSLNFPKFYEKTILEDGSPYYYFDNFTVREYDRKDNELFLEKLPFTESTIHEDDVQLIIHYLEYLIAWEITYHIDVTPYLLKLIDNREHGVDSPKVDSIVKYFRKTVSKVVGYDEQKEKHSCSCSKETEEVQEKLITPIIGMMETLAGAMLNSLEKNENEKNEKKDGEYVFNHTDKGIKIEKTSLKGPKTIVDKDFSKPARILKYNYNKKSSAHLMKLLDTLPFREKDIHEKDIKYIKKLMKDCVAQAKESKKLKKALTDFLMKVVDNSTLGDIQPKIEETFGNPKLGKLVREFLDKEDDGRMSEFEQDDRIRRLEKENKKLNKRLKKAKK